MPQPILSRRHSSLLCTKLSRNHSRVQSDRQFRDMIDMSVDPTKESMRDRVIEFIQALKRAPPFTASNYARAISSYLLRDGNLQDLKDLTQDNGINKDDLFRDLQMHHSQFKDSMVDLGAASLAMGMSAQGDDEFGFKRSANRDKALQLANSSLVNMVPYLIEAHIDHELNNAALATLRTLAKNKHFKELYFEILTSEAVQFSIEDDSATSFNGSNYRANLLYAYEFLRTGDTPFMNGTVPNTDSTSQSFSNVLKAWLEQVQSPNEHATFNDVFNKVLAAQTGGQTPDSAVNDWSKFHKDLMQIVLPATIVYLPNMNLSGGLPYIMETLLNSVAPDLMRDQTVKTKILSSIPPETLSFAQEIWVDWESETNFFGQAATKSIAMDTVRGTFIGDVWAGGDPPSSHKHKVNEHQYGANISAAQRRCKEVDVWNKEDLGFWKKHALYLRPAEDDLHTLSSVPEGAKKDGFRFWQEDLEKGKEGCFLPGTLVYTSNGPQPIENLQENDHILTRADTNEWGILSDEQVRMPVLHGKMTMWGINDEPVFFSAAHPFVDKFGRARAIDPITAHHENPWLEVGALKVGHVLLRTIDGVNYEEVPILRLHSTKVETRYIYGLHLREGLRNYHANGFLVRLNYPEITIKSIADALRRVPAQEQLRMIGHLKELEPVLSRFGSGTVMTLLTAELSKSDAELAAAKTKASAGPKVPGLYFQSRSFTLSADPIAYNKLFENYNYVLPNIDAVEGQIWINGTACHSARVYKRGFVWSRQLSDSLWEHGMCSFGSDHTLVAGDGLVWVDSDPSPQSISSKATRIHAVTVPERDPTVSPVYNGAAVADWAAPSAAEEINVAELQSADTASEQNFDYEDLSPIEGKKQVWTHREDSLQSQDMADSGRLLAGIELIDSIVEESAGASVAKAVAKIEGPTPIVTENSSEQIIETYDLTCSLSAFTEAPSSEAPVKVFQILKVRKTIANNVQRFDFVIPALDKLSQLLDRDNPATSGAQSFYETLVTRDELNELIVRITIRDPTRLALAADDNVDLDEYEACPKSLKSLRFATSGLPEDELYLPVVPNQLILNTKTLEGSVWGHWVEFEDDAVGDNGKLYAVQGARHHTAIRISPPSPVSAAEKPSPSPSGPTIPKFLPTHLSSRSKQDLTTGFRVDTTALKMDTQNLLKVAMYYHMDEEDRKGILGVDKRPVSTAASAYGPDEIPAALAETLDSDLSAWLKEKYAPAWIAQNVAYLNGEQQKAFNIRVDVKWQKRLRYFWQGSGQYCLSQCKEYNELTLQLAILTFRRRYPRIMEYVNDKSAITMEDTDNESYQGFTGGKKWAHLLFESLINKDMIAQIAQESMFAEITKLNTLEMYCTMLNALWRDNTTDRDKGTLAEQLSKAVRACLMKQDLFKHRSISDPKQLEQGIRDYLRELFTLLLDEIASKQAGIADDFRKTVIKEMVAYCGWNEDFAQRTAQKNVQILLDDASNRVKSAASYVTNTMGWKEHMNTGIRGGARLVNAIKRVIGRGEQSAVGPAPGPAPIVERPWSGGICVLLGVAMTMWYVHQAWDSWGQWIDDGKSLSVLDKTRLVASGLQAFGGVVLSTYKGVQLAKGWDPKTGKKAIDSIHAAGSELEMAVVNKAMYSHPDAILEEVDLATRARRNATASKDMAMGTRRAANVRSALLPDAQPQKWRQRITDLKNSAKMKMKGWGQSIKTRLSFNVTETFIRTFAAAMSIVMLVLACITVAQMWEKQEVGERILAVMKLIIQFIGVIIEIAVIFAAVPGYIGMIVALVGMAIDWVVNLIVGQPKPPTPRIVTWWNANGPDSNGFFKTIPPEPITTLKYSINQTEITSMQDTTLVITGEKRGNDAGDNNGKQRLKSISVRYTSAPGSKVQALFDSKKQALAEEMCKAEEPGTGEAYIAVPPSLEAFFDVETAKGSLIKKPVYTRGIVQSGPSTAWAEYDLGIEVDPTAVPTSAVLPSIVLQAGEKISFRFRGVIAYPTTKSEKVAATHSSDQTLSPDQVEIRIVETYADGKDELTGIVEEVLLLTKKVPPKKEIGK